MEYGYIIDYKHLFKHLKGAVNDYTTGPLGGYDEELAWWEAKAVQAAPLLVS